MYSCTSYIKIITASFYFNYVITQSYYIYIYNLTNLKK